MAESEADKKKREQDAYRFSGIPHKVGDPPSNSSISLSRDPSDPKGPRVVAGDPVSPQSSPATHTISLACSRRELELLKCSVKSVRASAGAKQNDADLERLEQKLAAALKNTDQ